MAVFRAIVAIPRYQKGAIDWAEATGIEASELRHPHKSEREGRIEGFRITFRGSNQVFSGTDISYDMGDWAKSLNREEALLVTQGSESAAYVVDPNALALEDSAGNSLRN